MFVHYIVSNLQLYACLPEEQLNKGEGPKPEEASGWTHIPDLNCRRLGFGPAGTSITLRMLGSGDASCRLETSKVVW